MQAVSQFSSALESGQLAPVVSQLSVNPEAVAAAAQGNMQEFVKALEKSATVTGGSTNDTNTSNNDTQEQGKKKNPEDDKDDDEGMQLD